MAIISVSLGDEDLESLDRIQKEYELKGRSDAVVWEKDTIYIFEFKIDKTAKEAMDQIKGKDCPIAYKNDGRKIVKVAVNYSSTKQQLDDWIIEVE